jgi:hypothetical protein
MGLSFYVFRGCIVCGIAASLSFSGCELSHVKAPDSCRNNLGSPISRFCQVTQNGLWRGAKPDKEGAAWLIEHEVKTIVNLELFNDDLPIIEQVNLTTPKTLKIEYFRVKDWEPLPVLAPSVEDEHVVHFLAIASQQANQPVYVHCRSGQNRTGIMVAAYKIIIEGNPNIGAVIEEMMAYQGFWSDVDAKYIRGLSLRRSDILQKIEEKIPQLEKPTQIICKDGKCTVALPLGQGENL